MMTSPPRPQPVMPGNYPTINYSVKTTINISSQTYLVTLPQQPQRVQYQQPPFGSTSLPYKPCAIYAPNAPALPKFIILDKNLYFYFRLFIVMSITSLIISTSMKCTITLFSNVQTSFTIIPTHSLHINSVNQIHSISNNQFKNLSKIRRFNHLIQLIPQYTPKQRPPEQIQLQQQRSQQNQQKDQNLEDKFKMQLIKPGIQQRNIKIHNNHKRRLLMINKINSYRSLSFNKKKDIFIKARKMNQQ
ncbi:unnamed protein product [Paramecium octaurelia]|uniref:Transmembrane protein n=1 Tax=Paramecium octaurelia TaxID=43137 RepID=A0A8S1W720_PAROT|nr:unnamed protein product [Paramecium octaurelia]